jgi:acetyltransferase-like isoleucine patch superfamily enzyme
MDPSAYLGPQVQIYQNTQVRENVTVGTNTKVGRNVYIGPGVTVGENCKIQNNALIYEPATLADGVFIGPGVILTNDHYPRAINLDLRLKTSEDWMPVGVQIGIGASIGAGAICIAPLVIGDWALIGAGAIVTKNVLPHALVVGNPAKQIGWVGQAGQRLEQSNDGIYICPSKGTRFKVKNGFLVEHEAS